MCNVIKLIFAIAFIAFLASVSSSLACEFDQLTLPEIRGDGSGLTKGPYTIEEVERSNLVTIRESGVELPFGAVNSQWEELKALKRPNDEIYWVFYTERSEANEGTNFYESYALVRDGCVIYTLMTEIGHEGDST
jgi:hypothetical protein